MNQHLLLQLKNLEMGLGRMLDEPAWWKSLFIDYEKPHVERLYADVGGDLRLMLHVIQPCERHEALRHPHPWPSAVHVLDTGGYYEMGIGHWDLFAPHVPGYTTEEITAGAEAPHWATHFVQDALIVQRGEMVYLMEDRRAAHYVRPVDLPSYSIMLVGKPWQASPARKPPKPQSPLTPERQEELRLLWRKLVRGGLIERSIL